MADALLSPAVGGGFWVATAATLSYAAKKLKDSLNERLIPLMGVLGAFVFAAQMINFTIPGTGSSGHLAGGLLLAILLGPHAAFIVLASVITVQALFFADGGLLALGCNIWNMGFYACYVVYPLIYRPLVNKDYTPKRITIASIISAVVALQLGAFSVVLQTKLSGISELPFKNFLLLMQPIHLAIGIVEGFITAGVVNYIRSIEPALSEQKTAVGSGFKKALIALSILAVITGGMLSWFASTHPDGLEWSIKNIYGKTELDKKLPDITSEFQKIQEKTAIMPDYSFPSNNEENASEAWPAPDAGTTVSGLVGGAMVLALVVVFGVVLFKWKKKGL